MWLAAQFYTTGIHVVLQKHEASFLMTCSFISIFIYLISSTSRNISSKIHQGWLHSWLGGGLQRWVASARKLPDKMDNCQIRWKIWTQICRSQMKKFSSFTSRPACVNEPGQKEVVFPEGPLWVWLHPIYMNYFASISFDLLNNSSRPWTSPFKAFCRLLNVMYL